MNYEAFFEMEDDVEIAMFCLFSHVTSHSRTDPFQAMQSTTKIHDIVKTKRKMNHILLHGIEMPLVQSFNDDRIFEAIQRTVLNSDIHSSFLFPGMDTGRTDTRELMKNCFLSQQRKVIIRFQQNDFTKEPRDNVVSNLLLEFVKLGYQSNLLYPDFSEQLHNLPLFPGMPFHNIVQRISSLVRTDDKDSLQRRTEVLRNCVLAGADPVSIVVFGAFHQLLQWVKGHDSAAESRQARSQFLTKEGQFIWFLAVLVESLGNSSVSEAQVGAGGDSKGEKELVENAEEEFEHWEKNRKQEATDFLATVPTKQKTELGTVWNCLRLLFPKETRLPGICKDRFLRGPGRPMREFLKDHVQDLGRKVLKRSSTCLPVNAILTDLYFVAGKRYLMDLSRGPYVSPNFPASFSAETATAASSIGGTSRNDQRFEVDKVGGSRVRKGKKNQGPSSSSADGKNELKKPKKPKQYEVEKILDSRELGEETEYFVKWKGFPESENTWEPEGNFELAPDAIALFEQTKKENRTDEERKKDLIDLIEGDETKENETRKRWKQLYRTVQKTFSHLRFRYTHLPSRDPKNIWVQVEREESDGGRGSDGVFVLQESSSSKKKQKTKRKKVTGEEDLEEEEEENKKFKVRKELSTVETEYMGPVKRIARFWTMDSVINFSRKFMIVTGRMKHKDRVRVPISTILVEHWAVRTVRTIQNILLCGVRIRSQDTDENQLARNARLAVLTKIFLLCPINNIHQTVQDCPVYVLPAGQLFPQTQKGIQIYFERHANKKKKLARQGTGDTDSSVAVRTPKQWHKFMVLLLPGSSVGGNPTGQSQSKWQICVLFQTNNVVMSKASSTSSSGKKAQVFHLRYGMFSPYLPQDLISNLQQIKEDDHAAAGVSQKHGYDQARSDMVNFVSRHGLWYPSFRKLGTPKPPALVVSVASVSQKNRGREPVCQFFLGEFPWELEKKRIMDTVTRSSVFGEHLLPKKNANARTDMYLSASKNLGEICSVLSKPLFQDMVSVLRGKGKNREQYPVYR